MKVRLPSDRLAMRTVLLLGFGLTLGLWLFSGYYFTRRVAEVQRQSEAIYHRYVRSQELLSTVRTQVLLGSVYVRDALLDPTPGAVVAYRSQLEAALTHVEDALHHYEPILDPRFETDQIAHLHTEVDNFRATVLEVLATDNSRWRAEARFLLRDRIMPKRQAVVSVSENVQALNRAAFVEQQQASARAYATTQRRIWTQFGLALIASFAIGLIATRHVGALESHLRDQQARDAANSRDLQRLSSQLISAQEEERRTISRELHDEVGQALTAIKVELSLAQRGVEAAGGSPTLLAEARSITDGALQTVRDLSRLLHPALLDDLGLCAAVEAYVREFRKRHPISVELVHERMDERLPQATEAAAYRIVQEALTNVVRHARATSCRVHLQRRADSILVTIEDDGVGFDPEKTAVPDARQGLGLIGIRERVAQLEGTERIDSAPGLGTRIVVELPVRVVAPAAERAGRASAPAVAGMVHG